MLSVLTKNLSYQEAVSRLKSPNALFASRAKSIRSKLIYVKEHSIRVPKSHMYGIFEQNGRAGVKIDGRLDYFDSKKGIVYVNHNLPLADREANDWIVCYHSKGSK